jgi:hypothetical protein
MWLPEDAELWQTCWDTIGYRRGNRRFLENGLSAHRFAYETFYGDNLRDGETVEHTCWNPECSNPMHLTSMSHGLNRHLGTLHNRVYCIKHHDPVLKLYSFLFDEDLKRRLVETYLPFCPKCANATVEQAIKWIEMVRVFEFRKNELSEWFGSAEHNHGYVCWLFDDPLPEPVNSGGLVVPEW